MAEDGILGGSDKSPAEKKKQNLYIAIAGGGLILTYLIYSHSKSTGGSATTQAATSAAGAQAYQPGTALSAYQAGQQQQLQTDQSWLGAGYSPGYSSAYSPAPSSGSTPTNNSGSNTTTSSTTGTTQASSLPPLVQTAQGPMYVLGQVGSGASASNTQGSNGSTNYQVYGGAPVYYGNTQTLAQGLQYDQQGSYLYTPQQYGSQIYGNGIPQP